MKTATAYFQELTSSVGNAWNRFWFTPSDPATICLMRICVGLAGVAYLLSHTADLATWFGPDGLLPVETVRHLSGAHDPSVPYFRISYLNNVDTFALLWLVHGLGILVLLAFAAGFFSRITAVMSLVVVLAYVHRAPTITGLVEPALTMLLFYLCLAPSGACYSMDAWLRKRRSEAAAVPVVPDTGTSVSATICLHLMQVHVAAFYLMMGLGQLGGETWWLGDAVWWLAARTESRVIDLSFLHRWLYLVNAWTHFIVFFELAFAVLIWNRTLRPLMLGLSLIVWGSMALVSGQLAFCGLMMLANICFFSPAFVRELVGQAARTPSTTTEKDQAEAVR